MLSGTGVATADVHHVYDTGAGFSAASECHLHDLPAAVRSLECRMSTRAGVPVSVVIPTYNRADRLEGAILSAVNQDPGPLEVIVVDDASTDGTDAARLEAIDRRVRVIRHPNNRGSAAARNTGIDAARGDWIAFLDHDDQWLPGKLERQWPQIAGLSDSRVFACGNVVFDGGAEDGRIRNSRPPREAKTSAGIS
jgi:glycosyltransferase involved in cell wall biosynthesis